MKVLEITKIADQTVKILSDVVGMDDVISLIKMLSITLKDIEADLVISEANHLKIEAKIKELELIIKGKDVIIESMAHGKSCDGCVYKSAMNNWCIKFDIKTHDGFCCNGYEPTEVTK